MKCISKLKGQCVCVLVVDDWLHLEVYTLKIKNNIKKVTLKTLSRLKEYLYFLLKKIF